jgi:hypothetical protein
MDAENASYLGDCEQPRQIHLRALLESWQAGRAAVTFFVVRLWRGISAPDHADPG